MNKHAVEGSAKGTNEEGTDTGAQLADQAATACCRLQGDLGACTAWMSGNTRKCMLGLGACVKQYGTQVEAGKTAACMSTGRGGHAAKV